MAVFEKQELIKPSFIQKIFNKQPKHNYIIELQNLLADNVVDLMSIHNSDIEILRHKYNVNIKAFKEERLSILDKYLNYCVEDKHLTDNELKKLQYLCQLLGLSDDCLITKIKEIGKIFYQNKVQIIISDDLITDEEKEELRILRSEFYLSDDEGRQIYNDACQKKIQEFVDNIIANRRMSPNEEKKLDDMILGLNVKVSFEDSGLKKLRLFWDVENGELPTMDSPINLQKGELLYYSSNIEWYEERTKTVMVSYGGITSNSRITKGGFLRYRFGYIFPERHTKDYMKLIDIGEVFFTNKRIIFVGSHGNKTISWSNILAIYPFANGIQLDKDSGKKPFFKCSDPELMGIYILRILKDY